MLFVNASTSSFVLKYASFSFLKLADVVLCTLPLGVLRHSLNFFGGQIIPTGNINLKTICAYNAIQFTPPLPEWKVMMLKLKTINKCRNYVVSIQYTRAIDLM